MPPKPKKNEPSKKTEQKKKDKTVEDKTFGLKNKRGAKQQRFIDHVTKQVQSGNKSAREMDKLQTDKLTRKDQKKKEQEELNALFRPVEQKVSKGADPKSVLCAFFKQGFCTKGDKCKFSHDMAIGRKAEKRSMYTEEEKAKDNMDEWDEEKLEEVINKKHGEKNKSMPKTAIICKYFLDAVENSKYGWFWSCPSGEGCHYVHALPAGFVLRKDKKRMDEQKEDAVSLEELIEKERAALSSKNLTKVTLESFNRWKIRKRQEKINKAKAAADKKKQDFKAGRTIGISGREMFEFNPELLTGDDDEADTVMYKPESDDEDGVDVREINLDALVGEAQENDGTGTMATSQKSASNGEPSVNGVDMTPSEERAKLDIAAALPPEASVHNENKSADDDAIADVNADDIDENLFDGEDLDLVEEELENLELVD